MPKSKVAPKKPKSSRKPKPKQPIAPELPALQADDDENGIDFVTGLPIPPAPAELVAARPIENHPALSGKVPSGWDKMKAAGRKGVMLSLTAEQYAAFKAAAMNDARKLAPWIVLQCLRSIQTV